METFVRRLFGEAEYRRKFLADPLTAIRGASLSASERQTVLRVASTLAAVVIAVEAGSVAAPQVEMVWM